VVPTSALEVRFVAVTPFVIAATLAVKVPRDEAARGIEGLVVELFLRDAGELVA
jgi:hypothetical protein